MRADPSRRLVVPRRGRAVVSALAVALALVLGTGTARALTSTTHDVPVSTQQTQAQSPSYRPASLAPRAAVHTRARVTPATASSPFDGLLPTTALVLGLGLLGLVVRRRPSALAGLGVLLPPGRAPPPRVAFAGGSAF